MSAPIRITFPPIPGLVVLRQSGPIRIVTGAPAPGGGGGGGGTPAFEFVQSSPATMWTVNHNLGVEPIVRVLSVGGVEVSAEIVHVSVNQVRVYFASAQAGRVRCI